MLPQELRFTSTRTGFSGVDISATIMLPAMTDRRGNIIRQNNAASLAYELGSIQTISISSFNEKSIMKGLGQRKALGYARGGITFAGTLMFNQIHGRVLDDNGRGTIIDDRGGILTYSSGDVYYDRRSSPELLLNVQRVIDSEQGDFSIVEEPQVNRRHMFTFSWDNSRIGRVLSAGELPPFDIICLYVNELGNVGKTVLYGVDIVSEGTVLSVEDIYTEVSYQYVARDVEFFAPINHANNERWISRTLYGQAPDVGLEPSESEVMQRVVNFQRKKNDRWNLGDFNIPSNSEFGLA